MNSDYFLDVNEWNTIKEIQTRFDHSGHFVGLLLASGRRSLTLQVQKSSVFYNFLTTAIPAVLYVFLSRVL
jgi:hypothetical protein